MTARQSLKGCVSKMNSQDATALKSIADHYGKESQLIKLQEECGELWGAIHSYVKDAFPPCFIAEEIADVSIMIDQVIYLMGLEDEVDEQITYKLRRQIERIKNEDGNYINSKVD